MGEPSTIHVVVVAAVLDGDRGLLVVRKRDDGQWGCPQGWLRADETPRETAKRKVSEETGVLVSVEKLLSVRTIQIVDSPGEASLYLLVQCHPLAGAPRPGIFELEAGYHSLQELPDLRDGQRDWILAALNGDGSLLE